MEQKIYDDVLLEMEKVINGFRVNDYKDGKLLVRVKELFEMVKSYDMPLDQKVYVFKKGAMLLISEVVHDIFPATDYFRENSMERFLVFQTPGQAGHDSFLNNWKRQGEAGVPNLYYI